MLRDGASSQYGSDAIAGVITVRLRRAEGGRTQITYGQCRTDMDGVLQQGGPVVIAAGLPVLDPNAGAGGVYQLTDTGKCARPNLPHESASLDEACSCEVGEESISCRSFFDVTSSTALAGRVG